jgi:DNA polymerase I-like protein with 3'-5' exonuclease and polymerase domains
VAEPDEKKPARAPHLKHAFVDAQNRILGLGKVYRKLEKDVLRHHWGMQEEDGRFYTPLDIEQPLGDLSLICNEESPICRACGLYENKCAHPFIKFTGSADPLITVIFDSVSTQEDEAGRLASEGYAHRFKKLLVEHVGKTGVPINRMRFASITRCANRLHKTVNFRTKGQYCRLFLLEDLRLHPPKLIMPIGSVVLGLLSHKSSAQNWGGRLLTWRGWPDDWLTEPKFVKPRTVLVGKEKVPVTVVGHPLFGPPPGPEGRCLLYPVQSPRIIVSFQNNALAEQWLHQVLRGVKLAKDGADPLQYNLPHYRIITDPKSVKAALRKLIDCPGTLVAYDTETEGLHPFTGEKIVFMMFRYTDADTKKPIAFGFPWEYDEDPDRGPASPLLPYVEEIKPYVEQALTSSVLVGHNTSFDALFTFKALSSPGDDVPLDKDGNVRQEWQASQVRLTRLADAFVYDTWHMAYTRRQERGSLGLEAIAYDFAPELAGYEEDFTLLIDLERERLHPEHGGHYARCPLDKWESHLKPYVMGDVETCYRIRETLERKLQQLSVYKFPLAHATQRGSFRYFVPPNRAWLYTNIMSPAARVLTKIMGRGMFIDQKALADLEDRMPKAILESIARMKEVGHGAITSYIDEMKATDKEANNPDLSKRWEFDLESKDQLRTVLFERLGLKIQRLTKTGRKLYGEDRDEWDDKITAAIRTAEPTINDDDMARRVEATKLKYAAVDRFTLNSLAVEHEEVRPLQEYRKIYKLYTTYVRPLRNMRFVGIDKKERSQIQHLCPDGCIHAQFMMTGTRGGRTSSRSPNLQNLPKEGVKHGSVELQVKTMYSSRFGSSGCIYGADMSQIELRLLAALSGDESMVNAYHRDIDLHSLTASRVFSKPYEMFSKEHRRKLEAAGKSKEAKELSLMRDLSKTTNFLTGYGGGAFGLQTSLANRQIYRTIEECERVIDAFFDSYPAVRDFLSYYKRFIEDNQVAVSIFGRVRVFEEVLSQDQEAKSKALRAGCNHVIQSTASDMVLIGLYVVEQMMREAGLNSILVSTVHDSLVFDALRSELPQIHEITGLVLNNLPDVFKTCFGEDYDTSWMLVPFACDSEVGPNYGAMRGVGKNPDWDKLLAKSSS